MTAGLVLTHLVRTFRNGSRVDSSLRSDVFYRASRTAALAADHALKNAQEIGHAPTLMIALASVAPLRAMFSRRSSRLLRSCERSARELAVHVAIALLTV
jgi:hypothetical protein